MFEVSVLIVGWRISNNLNHYRRVVSNIHAKSQASTQHLDGVAKHHHRIHGQSCDVRVLVEILVTVVLKSAYDAESTFAHVIVRIPASVRISHVPQSL